MAHHKRIPSPSFTMPQRQQCTILFQLCIVMAVAVTISIAADQTTTSLWPGTSTQSAPATPHQAGLHTKDAIYIDDDTLEGSGHHGHGHDDVDREPDYSGSGQGEDDEDSGRTHHNKHSDRNNLGGSSGSKSSGVGGGQQSKKNNQSGVGSGNHEEDHFAGSGDGLTGGEHDDDEDRPFDVPMKPIGTHGNGHDGKENPVSEHDNDLEIDPEDGDEMGGGGIDEDEEEEEEVTELNDLRTGETLKNSPGLFDPTTSDDEDIEKEQSNRHKETDINGSSVEDKEKTSTDKNNEVFIMNAKNDDRTASFFSQPGILAAVIGGAVVGLLCAILVVMFIVYRMRKKDEGSYALDEPKRSPAVNSYAKNTNNREFYA